jgi:N-formylglutamate amidohydrolase
MRLIFAFFLFISGVSAQSYEPGLSYFDADQYIEYIAGNLPLVITVPHGGHLTPTNLPDRNCTGCSYVKDGNTQEIARALNDALYARTGCYPHTTINLLHRRKLDANREVIEASDSNAIVGQIWEHFHDFIGHAQDSVKARFGKGFYLDLHAHGHAIQRLELGYVLTKSQLQLSDSLINTAQYINVSSLRKLVPDNLQNLNHAALLRGEQSLGALLHNKGYPSVPSPADSMPNGDEPYFNGGYNTNRYCRTEQNVLSGVQIETNYTGIRDNAANIAKFADSLAVTLLQYLRWHYLETPSEELCASAPVSAVPSDPEHVSELLLSPTPFRDQLRILWSGQEAIELEIFSWNGQLLHSCWLDKDQALQFFPPMGGNIIVIARQKGNIKARKVATRIF